MHIERLTIENLRSIRSFKLDLAGTASAGWHVILGDNGAGKSTVVRTLALALMGPTNSQAARQVWSRWLTTGHASGQVAVTFSGHDEDRWTGKGNTSKRPITARANFAASAHGDGRNGDSVELSFSGSYAKRTIWGNGCGWFSASFGPFRRFSGGDPRIDRLFVSHPRLASHLSAFGEDVALRESLLWLQDLQIKKLEKDSEAEVTQDAVIAFINKAGLLPHGARVTDVTSERVEIIDGNGARIDVEEMSDGYRSILSLTFELMRLMFRTLGAETALKGINPGSGTIALPGVVAIDEVDAHLHPAWQQSIGDWFVERFPETQFFVTSHSPIICRAARRGSIWLLPVPGSGETARRIAGTELDRLLDGNILDAYGTDLFGKGVTRSEESKKKLERLAGLNRKRLTSCLSPSEQGELDHLRAGLPSNPNSTAPGRGRRHPKNREHKQTGE